MRDILRKLRKRVRVCRAIGGLLALLGFSGHACPVESQDRFSEQVTVAERRVFFDDSVLPSDGARGRRAMSDFLVRLDGATADPLDSNTTDPPHVLNVVWVDPNFASVTHRAAAARQMAAAIERFPERETFCLTETRGTTTPSFSTISRAELLLKLQRMAETKHVRPDSTPSLEDRVAALDRLAVEISGYPSSDLGAIWLMAEPWPLDPHELEAVLNPTSAMHETDSLVSALERSARVLASYNWVVFPVVAGTGGLLGNSRVRPSISEADRIHDSGASPREARFEFLKFILFGRRDRNRRSGPSSLLTHGALDAATDPRLAPLRVLARETSGSVAGDADRIGALADRLRLRRSVFVRDPDADNPILRSSEVLWVGGDGRRVPAIPWVGPRQSHELAVSRLLTARQELEPVGAPLEIRSVDTPGGRLPAVCFKYRHDHRSLRLTVWNSNEKRAEIGEPLEVPKGSDECAPIPGPANETYLVHLEALDAPYWGAGTLATVSQR